MKLPGAFRAVGDELGDKMRNVPAGTEVRDRDQLKRTWVLRTEIGPAVLNGGISTFLAFILLAKSDSHVFMTFFKVSI